MTRLGSMTVLVMLVLLGACSDPIQPDPQGALVQQLIRYPDCEGPATSVDPAFGVTPTVESNLRMHEVFAALARELPGGFAGVFYDRSQPVFLLTDPSQANAAKAAIIPYLMRINNFDVAGAEVRAARWDFAQLTNWYNYIFARTPVGTTAGVTFHDTDVMRNRIYIAVDNAQARERLLGALAPVALPCDLIFIKTGGS